MGTKEDQDGGSASWLRMLANCSTVGAWSKVARGKVLPNVFSIWANKLIASSDCPPNSKKLSLTPIDGMSKTSVQSCVSLSSKGFRGATQALSCLTLGCLTLFCCNCCCSASLRGSSNEIDW